MNVAKFTIKESTFNKGLLVLVAETECGKRFVVAGQHHSPTYLEPYETSSDVKQTEKKEDTEYRIELEE